MLIEGLLYLKLNRKKKTYQSRCKAGKQKRWTTSFWPSFRPNKNEGTRQFSCQSFWIDQSENCSCTCLLVFWVRPGSYVALLPCRIQFSYLKCGRNAATAALNSTRQKCDVWTGPQSWFHKKKKGLSRLHNWKFPQSYTTSRKSSW